MCGSFFYNMNAMSLFMFTLIRYRALSHLGSYLPLSKLSMCDFVVQAFALCLYFYIFTRLLFFFKKIEDRKPFVKAYIIIDCVLSHCKFKCFIWLCFYIFMSCLADGWKVMLSICLLQTIVLMQLQLAMVCEMWLIGQLL